MNGQLNQAVEDAKGILSRALLQAQHAEDCARARFIAHHKNHPAGHPIWLAAPGCSCWFSDAVTFLNLH